MGFASSKKKKNTVEIAELPFRRNGNYVVNTVGQSLADNRADPGDKMMIRCELSDRTISGLRRTVQRNGVNDPKFNGD